jgi:oligopeptide/dipeptide ABC transporter ATP-binding protein
MASSDAPLLEVSQLRIKLPTPQGLVTVVDGVDLVIEPGQVYGIAGESGSGKTITALSLLRLLPQGAVVEGRAMLGSRDLLALGRSDLRSVRGREVAMVFQDPMTSMHPMIPVGRQLTDHLRAHLGTSRADARRRAIELLAEVRIPDPEGALKSFPHQFSGGMRQRIAIAIALACEPKLLLADEPTTALDVTVQAGIIRLLDRLRRETGVAILLITHDLGVMSSIAEWVSVFYAGRIVESGLTADIIGAPRHPYTRGLLGSLPAFGADAEAVPQLRPIAGQPPSPADRPAGCPFHPRCEYAEDRCTEQLPELLPMTGGRSLACVVDPSAA